MIHMSKTMNLMEDFQQIIWKAKFLKIEMDTFLNFSNSNIWSEIWPELTLALGALFILGVDLFRKGGTSFSTGVLAIVFRLGYF